MPGPNAKRRIAVGADHGGYELKEAIKAHLQKSGYDVEDCGTHGTQPVDYPIFARSVAQRVAGGQAERGIMVDRAGIGSAMAANKVPGVRAALCYDLSTARNSREHNDANVLTLGSGLIGPDLALQIVDVWLATECTAERHLRRVAMIEASRPAGGPIGSPAAKIPGESSVETSAKGLESGMDQLTAADIERIARRMEALSGGAAATAGSVCGSSCSSPACAYCQACARANPEFLRELVSVGADRVGYLPGGETLPEDLAAYIDHTLLKPDATPQQIHDLCSEAIQYQFATVCVQPCNVRQAAERLKGSSVKVCSVVGFPTGAHVSEIKALETRRAIRDGAEEIDMVIQIGALKGGDDELVYRDIRAVTLACMDGGAISKVIIEAALLTDDEKIRACLAAKRARADFVKTSTGFGPGGATAHDVALMAGAVCGTGMGVKAAGGIRSLDDAQAMIRAGATRLGASASVRIVKEAKGLTVSEPGTGVRVKDSSR
jgi:deoxyribose-phosphate aldolase